MVYYRRCQAKGGTYFFTVNLKNRQATFLTDFILQLKSAITEVKSAWPFIIQAMVVLPDHLHSFWQLPEDDSDYANRWRLIKSKFTQSLIKEGITLHKDRYGLYNLWQRRFWEHLIRDTQDYENHVNYIH